ncbi:hypothetical protein WICPIJ_003782 [Wickerhamomyces pijperi]|uniref:DUF8032 domain-containing protein n=1 Tax=Wickerhamomyces pijperi TaxID=599730 RepID=A0A9P8Q6T8_WICPI|nr:hypothetical protein WICPIJ_003782 [Wickerhamomyces pijperi]
MLQDDSSIGQDSCHQLYINSYNFQSDENISSAPEQDKTLNSSPQSIIHNELDVTSFRSPWSAGLGMDAPDESSTDSHTVPTYPNLISLPQSSMLPGKFDGYNGMALQDPTLENLSMELPNCATQPRSYNNNYIPTYLNPYMDFNVTLEYFSPLNSGQSVAPLSNTNPQPQSELLLPISNTSEQDFSLQQDSPFVPISAFHYGLEPEAGVLPRYGQNISSNSFELTEQTTRNPSFDNATSSPATITTTATTATTSENISFTSAIPRRVFEGIPSPSETSNKSISNSPELITSGSMAVFGVPEFITAKQGPLPAYDPIITINEAENTETITFPYTKKQPILSYSLTIPRFTESTRWNLLKSLNIPEKFRLENAIYTKALAPEQLYRGKRQNYEMDCNELGWIISWFNQDQIRGNKGLLQRAVDNWRNSRGKIELMSRRQRRTVSKLDKGNKFKELSGRKNKKSCEKLKFSFVAPVVAKKLI